MSGLTLVRLGLVVVLAAAGTSGARADGFGPHPALPTSGYGHVDRSGLNEHVARGLLEGIIVGGFIGYALSNDTDERTSTRVGTGIVLGATAGVVLPLALNHGGKEVRTGDVIVINVAQDWGLAHGGLVPLIFQLSKFNHADDVDLTRDQARLDLGLAAGVSLAAGGLAAYATDDLNFSPGQASVIGSAGLWGGLTGALLMGLARPNDASIGWTQASIAAALGVGDAAMLLAWYRRDAFDMDRSRALMINLGGLAGLAVGVAAAYFIDPSLDNDRVVSGALLAGSALGLGTTFYLTDGWDDFKQGAPHDPQSPHAQSNVGGGRSLVAGPMSPRMAGDRGLPMRPILPLFQGRF